MIRAAILLLLAFARIGQPAETWYFAQMIDTGEIVAFTMDGAIRPASVSGDWQYGLRLDSRTVLLGIAPDQGATRLYRVTPDGAVEIEFPGSAEDFRQPLAFSNPYVVLRQNTSPLPTPALLINAANAQAEVLTGQLPALARMSADGRRLRYMSVDGERWSLIERALATGAEHVVGDFTTDNPLPPISADAHGERWIFQTRAENRLPVYTLLTIDGASTILDSGTRAQPLGWSFLNDALIGNSLGCDEMCALQVIRDPSETTMALPGDDVYQPLAAPEPGSLLVLDSARNFWLLAAGADARLLGQYDPLRIFMPAHQLISPDARCVLTGAGENRYAVWDLRTGSPVAIVNARYVGLILYNEQGFLIYSYGEDEDNGLAYRYADGETLTLPRTDLGIYLDMLPDGTLVYMLQKAADEIGEPGIYRYDPASDTYAAVLPGARLTYPQALG